MMLSSNSSTEATGNFFFPTSSETTNMVDLNIPLPLVEIENDDGDVSPFNLLPPLSSYRRRQRISALDQAYEKELQDMGSSSTSDPKKLRRLIHSFISLYLFTFKKKKNPNMFCLIFMIRTISNRLSAQRSRDKKAKYISELEEQIGNLEVHTLLLF